MRRCEPSTLRVLPFTSIVVTTRPASPETLATFAPSTISTPSRRRRSTAIAESSGSSRPNTRRPSSTVTFAPSRRWACAISMPMGPPPTTIRCAGHSVFSKIFSLVKKGSLSRPGIGGTAAREPVATTKRRAVISLSAGDYRAAVLEAGMILDDGDAERLEAGNRIVGRDGGDDTVDMGMDGGEVDFRLCGRDAERGAGAHAVCLSGGGEQRLRRNAAGS